MPIKNIPLSQTQQKIFAYKLKDELNPKNKLYKLRSLIDWQILEDWCLKNIDVKKLGRDRNCNRIMISLLMLQSMNNTSDSLTAEEVKENMYWQYFCGYEYLEKNIEISESSIRRFRNLLGEEGLNEILKELIKVGVKTGAVKKKDLESIIVDSTVQIKNIKHPHDAHLMSKSRENIVKLCNDFDISLNETYAKKYKFLILQLWKYKKDSKAKKRFKALKRLKTLLGRLIRKFEREVENRKLVLQIHHKEQLKTIKSIHAQSALNGSSKKEYKKTNRVLYSFHATEVECIGKGKLHKPYEFGNKVSIAVSGKNNFVLCAKSFHGNPYDGRTLDQTVEKVRGILDCDLSIKKIFLDNGYKGNNFAEKGKIYSSGTKKKLDKSEKKMLKRRSSIEPIIGHLKNFGRMGRNYLKGKVGDIINPIISAIGLNLRNISNHLISQLKPQSP